MEWTVDKRTGKVFFDHNQNSRGKTLASVYSPRPSPEAAVSVPVQWGELREIYPTDFTILTTPDRIAQAGDLWSEYSRPSTTSMLCLRLSAERPGRATGLLHRFSTPCPVEYRSRHRRRIQDGG